MCRDESTENKEKEKKEDDGISRYERENLGSRWIMVECLINKRLQKERVDLVFKILSSLEQNK